MPQCAPSVTQQHAIALARLWDAGAHDVTHIRGNDDSPQRVRKQSIVFGRRVRALPPAPSACPPYWVMRALRWTVTRLSEHNVQSGPKKNLRLSTSSIRCTLNQAVSAKKSGPWLPF
jgi:hypothetical protein